MNETNINFSEKMKNKRKVLIEKGLYDNQSEVAREALRNLLLKYKRELDNRHAKK